MKTGTSTGTPSSVIDEFTNLRIEGFGLGIAGLGDFARNARGLVHSSSELRLVEDGRQFIRLDDQIRQFRIVAGLRGSDEFEPVHALVGLLDNMPELRDEIIVRASPTGRAV